METKLTTSTLPIRSQIVLQLGYSEISRNDLIKTLSDHSTDILLGFLRRLTSNNIMKSRIKDGKYLVKLSFNGLEEYRKIRDS